MNVAMKKKSARTPEGEWREYMKIKILERSFVIFLRPFPAPGHHCSLPLSPSLSLSLPLPF
jgi:hypothetical protein